MVSKLCALIVQDSLINIRSLVRSLLTIDDDIFIISPSPFKNEIPDRFGMSKNTRQDILLNNTHFYERCGSIKRDFGRNHSNEVKDT